MTNWSANRLIRAVLIVAILVMTAIVLLPLNAQESPAPEKTRPVEQPAQPKDADDEPDTINPGDEHVSADNNLSFPVDI
jgi:hypothetical protein